MAYLQPRKTERAFTVMTLSQVSSGVSWIRAGRGPMPALLTMLENADEQTKVNNLVLSLV